jgi:hypothetical protein
MECLGTPECDVDTRLLPFQIESFHKYTETLREEMSK